MGKIKKILENELIGGTQNIDVYPITSIKAVYNENNERLDDIINRKSNEIEEKLAIEAERLDKADNKIKKELIGTVPYGSTVMGEIYEKREISEDGNLYNQKIDYNGTIISGTSANVHYLHVSKGDVIYINVNTSVTSTPLNAALYNKVPSSSVTESNILSIYLNQPFDTENVYTIIEDGYFAFSCRRENLSMTIKKGISRFSILEDEIIEVNENAKSEIKSEINALDNKLFRYKLLYSSTTLDRQLMYIYKAIYNGSSIETTSTLNNMFYFPLKGYSKIYIRINDTTDINSRVAIVKGNIVIGGEIENIQTISESQTLTEKIIDIPESTENLYLLFNLRRDKAATYEIYNVVEAVKSLDSEVNSMANGEFEGLEYSNKIETVNGLFSFYNYLINEKGLIVQNSNRSVYFFKREYAKAIISNQSEGDGLSDFYWAVYSEKPTINITADKVIKVGRYLEGGVNQTPLDIYLTANPNEWIAITINRAKTGAQWDFYEGVKKTINIFKQDFTGELDSSKVLYNEGTQKVFNDTINSQVNSLNTNIETINTDNAKINEDLTIVKQNISTLDNKKVTVEKLDTSVLDLINASGGGSITNNVDGEDLTTEEVDGVSVIKFANRDNINGLGYKILRKNKPLNEQLAEGNTIYEVRYDYILSDGEVIKLKENTVLYFNGGSISNNGLKANGCIFSDNKSTIVINPPKIIDGVNDEVFWGRFFNTNGQEYTYKFDIFKRNIDLLAVPSHLQTYGDPKYNGDQLIRRFRKIGINSSIANISYTLGKTNYGLYDSVDSLNAQYPANENNAKTALVLLDGLYWKYTSDGSSWIKHKNEKANPDRVTNSGYYFMDKGYWLPFKTSINIYNTHYTIIRITAIWEGHGYGAMLPREDDGKYTEEAKMIISMAVEQFKSYIDELITLCPNKPFIHFQNEDALFFRTEEMIDLFIKPLKQYCNAKGFKAGVSFSGLNDLPYEEDDKAALPEYNSSLIDNCCVNIYLGWQQLPIIEEYRLYQEEHVKKHIDAITKRGFNELWVSECGYCELGYGYSTKYPEGYTGGYRNPDLTNTDENPIDETGYTYVNSWCEALKVWSKFGGIVKCVGVLKPPLSTSVNNIRQMYRLLLSI